MKKLFEKLSALKKDYSEYRETFVRKQIYVLRRVSLLSLLYAVVAPFLVFFIAPEEKSLLEFGPLGILALLGILVTFFLLHGKEINKPERVRTWVNMGEVAAFVGGCCFLFWGNHAIWCAYFNGRGVQILVWIIMYLIITALFSFMPFMALIMNGLEMVVTMVEIYYLSDGKPNMTTLYNVVILIIIISYVMIDKYLYEQYSFKKSKMVKEMQEDRERFLVSMTHEMRTPLNAVLGKNQIIYRDTNDEDIKTLSKEISSSGKHLLSLINDILDLSKMEAGKMNILPVNYNSYNVTYEIANIMRSEANAKGLGFKLEVSENVPKGLFGDDVRIKQVIMNLVSNAIKYTKEGSVTLRVWFSYLNPDEKKGLLNVMVIDTGIGIKAENLPNLTKAFQRVDDDGNRNIQGTGLGLAITANLLKLMGSELKMESQYEIGSTFSFSVWQGVTDAESLRESDAEVLESKNRMFKAPDANILVVDDNAVNFSVCKGLMKYYSIVPDHADSGKKCLSMIAVKKYDIIFLDHMMPGLSGIETLEIIKKEYPDVYEKTVIVALTANESSDSEAVYKEYGFKGYLSKPLDGSRLHTILEENIMKSKITYTE